MNNDINNELTKITEKLIDVTFADSHKSKVIDILKTECGNNLPFCDNFTSKQLERIRFAVLKTSIGSFDEFLNSVNLAKADWRDLLVLAGFANDTTSHDKWATVMIGSRKS